MIVFRFFLFQMSLPVAATAAAVLTIFSSLSVCEAEAAIGSSGGYSQYQVGFFFLDLASKCFLGKESSYFIAHLGFVCTHGAKIAKFPLFFLGS